MIGGVVNAGTIVDPPVPAELRTAIVILPVYAAAGERQRGQ